MVLGHIANHSECFAKIMKRFTKLSLLPLQPWSTHEGTLNRQGSHKHDSIAFLFESRKKIFSYLPIKLSMFPPKALWIVYSFSVRMPSHRQTNVYWLLCVLKRHSGGAGGLYGSWKVTLEVKMKKQNKNKDKWKKTKTKLKHYLWERCCHLSVTILKKASGCYFEPDSCKMAVLLWKNLR